MTSDSPSSKPSKAPYWNGWLLCRVISGPFKYKIGCTRKDPTSRGTRYVRFAELVYHEIPDEQIEILCGCWAARTALEALASVTD